jgi:hypothetical protein
MAKLIMERDAKVLDHKARLELEQMKETAADRRFDKELETKITIAEITTKAQADKDRQQFTQDMWNTVHDAAHDAAKQAVEHEHEKHLAERQAATAQAQQAAQIDADQKAQAAQAAQPQV